MTHEEALRLILPMAKGYAAAHPVGNNEQFILDAEAVLSAAPVAGDQAAHIKELEGAVLALRESLEECSEMVFGEFQTTSTPIPDAVARANSALVDTTPSATAIRERIERDAWNGAVEACINKADGLAKTGEPKTLEAEAKQDGFNDALEHVVENLASLRKEG